MNAQGFYCEEEKHGKVRDKKKMFLWGHLPKLRGPFLGLATIWVNL